MPAPARAVSLAVLLAGAPLLGITASSLVAQAPTLPSDSLEANFEVAPTLPSDTLEANFAPRGGVAPMPWRAPSLPSDTIEIGAPLDTTGLNLGEPDRPK